MNDEDTYVVWLDLALNLLGGFILIAALLLFVAQPKQKPVSDEANNGSVSVYIFWKDGIDLDVDVRAQSPDGQIIDYRRMSGHVWSLLRDDLGMINDPGQHNFENLYARYLVAGDYTINIHAFRGGPLPIDVQAEVRFLEDGKDSSKVFTKTFTLRHIGEELTMLRFSIGADHKLIPGSMNSICKPLVNASCG